MNHAFIGKKGSSPVPHDLMHLDQNPSIVLRVKTSGSTFGPISLHCSIK